jgi:hypothetical protein
MIGGKMESPEPLNGSFPEIPPDLVVKFQAIDIVEVI